MAYQNTGFKRSMKVAVTRNGSDGSSITTTYDGQGAFGTHSAIVSNYDFRRLVRNNNNGDWDIRLADFKAYMLGEVGAPAYASIDWDKYSVMSVNQYDVVLISIIGTHSRDIVAVLYNGSSIVDVAPETINITFDTLTPSTIPLQIAPGASVSGIYSMVQSDGVDIRDISNPTVSPTISNNGSYSITIDTVNEW
jgi:hypothetical protein